MYTLYERRNPVFIDPAANTGCVLDLRLHWTSGAQITAESLGPTITESIQPGGSVVAGFDYTPESYCSIGFVGEHPLYPEVYYSAGVVCSTVVTGYERYIVDNAVYMVNSQVYHVKYEVTSEQDIHSTVAWGGGYILLDLGAENNPHISGALIEPFNIIFDPISGKINGKDTTFNNSISIASNVFTNTPRIGGLIVPETAYTFVVNGNVLELSAPTVGAFGGNSYIKSINGILPVDGNFTIQVLE